MSLASPLLIGVTQGLLMAWVVLGFGLAYRLLEFPDLTVEGSLSLSSAVYAALLVSGTSAFGACIAATLASAFLGAITAFLHYRLKLNKFLSGIIVVAISYSLTLRIMRGPNIGLINTSGLLTKAEPLVRQWGQVGIIVALLALYMLSAITLALFLRSRPGIRMRAAGASSLFAESIGLNAGLRLVLGLAFTNGLAAISGMLMCDYQGFADVGSGQGVLILALAALTLGEAMVPQRRLPYYLFVLASSFAGSIAYQLIVSVSVRVGLAPTDLRLATGVLVLVVVIVRVSRSGRNADALLMQ